MTASLVIAVKGQKKAIRQRNVPDKPSNCKNNMLACRSRIYLVIDKGRATSTYIGEFGQAWPVSGGGVVRVMEEEPWLRYYSCPELEAIDKMRLRDTCEL